VNKNPSINIARALVGFTLYLLFVPALLFIFAGTLNWPMAWVYVTLLLLSTIGSRLVTALRSPELLYERARFTEAEGVKEWDHPLVGIVGLYGPMAMMIVAGLDYRYNWSVSVPTIGQYTAAALVAVGYGVAVLAMITNQFFSSVARIQSERGQFVVTSGPYKFVRHPSYAGALIAAPALPFMLQTLWALVPGVVVMVVLVVRTKLEDRMLLEELEGYAEYANKTPYRLIPGIW